jgi:formylglycine-generating enzyme required for sulfatase activity
VTSTPRGELPAHVDAAIHALFGLPEHEQSAAFRELVAAHPDHAGVLTERWLAVVGGERAASRAPEATPAGLARYRVDGVLGRGGMGEVLAASDLLLERPVALKVVRGGADALALQRCRNEARVTARLEHPGVPPVHDLGTDDDGAAWFVMRRIDGVAADAVFAAAVTGARAQARALDVLRRVADTLAFAHTRGIVHRDLKPANVMIGAFGEVYVVDWGLAKHAHGSERADAPALAADATRAADGDRTLAGTVLGTPSYIPPERAHGAVTAGADPREDVYAVGAMLYQLLVGHAPYAGAGGADAILAALRAGPPAPLARVAPRAPAALAAICTRAMARAPAARYPDMRELAADVAAFLEARAVKAHRTGPVVELALWMRRNRALAAAITALAAVGAAALVVVSLAFRDADESRRRFRGLAGVAQLAAARRVAAELHPPWPEQHEALAAWTRTYAEPLRAQHAALTAELDRIAARALPPLDPRAAPRFADVDDGILHASLSRHAADLAAFFASGGLADAVQERRRWAATIAARSIDANRAGWQRAIAAVAADARYRGLALVPQVGLVPLGADPRSGLQEFAELRSGTVPQRDAAGALQLADDTGIVLVLLPGGDTWLGAQSDDPGAPGYWPGARADEAPVQRVAIAPFLLGKHELTQAQWQRLAGYNPSLAIGSDTARRPVGHIGWNDAERVLREEGMTLPTEAQWEHACRAGARTAFATGDSVASLAGHANVADESARHAYGPSFRHEAGFDDGFAADAPVGTFAPNAFGLCDLHGNHWEWCLDAYAAPRGAAPEPREGRGPIHRVMRGGSYAVAADHFARCAYRGKAPADTALHDVGLRAARTLRP